MIDGDHLTGVILYIFVWGLDCVKAVCRGLAFVLVREIRRCNRQALEYIGPAFALFLGVSIGASRLKVALPSRQRRGLLISVVGVLELALGFGAFVWAGLVA